jgi:hypothetical protein
LVEQHRDQQPSWPGAVHALAGELDDADELTGADAGGGDTAGGAVL